MCSEDVWFVWFKTSYSGEKVGCHDKTDGKVKIGQESGKQDSQ